jgi:hypothetical protein
VGIDEDNCGKFAREFKRLTHRVSRPPRCALPSLFSA